MSSPSRTTNLLPPSRGAASTIALGARSRASSGTNTKRNEVVNSQPPLLGNIQPALTGRLTLTDVDTMLAACLAGGGIAQVMAFGVEDHLSSGQLVNLFPDWSDEMFPLYAVHPSRRHVPAKVRAFIGFCQEVLNQSHAVIASLA
jgi:DNA-binding transcriptional LysR family regulator